MRRTNPGRGGSDDRKSNIAENARGEIGNTRKSITQLAEESVAINDVREGCMLTLFAVGVKQVNKFIKFAGVSTEERNPKMEQTDLDQTHLAPNRLPHFGTPPFRDTVQV